MCNVAQIMNINISKCSKLSAISFCMNCSKLKISELCKTFDFLQTFLFKRHRQSQRNFSIWCSARYVAFEKQKKSQQETYYTNITPTSFLLSFVVDILHGWQQIKGQKWKTVSFCRPQMFMYSVLPRLVCFPRLVRPPKSTLSSKDNVTKMYTASQKHESTLLHTNVLIQIIRSTVNFTLTEEFEIESHFPSKTAILPFSNIFQRLTVPPKIDQFGQKCTKWMVKM